MSKLEVVLQPMDNQWYQLGHHLNVEVSLLREIEQKKDAKEQMRSLLQLCSDRGVTMMQLEEALVALDQKSLIPGNLCTIYWYLLSSKLFNLKV